MHNKLKSIEAEKGEDLKKMRQRTKDDVKNTLLVCMSLLVVARTLREADRLFADLCNLCSSKEQEDAEKMFHDFPIWKRKVVMEKRVFPMFYRTLKGMWGWW